MPPKSNWRRQRGKNTDELRNRQRSRWLKQAPKNTGDSSEDVPLLQWGSRNNWLQFKEKMKTACLEKFGNLGRIIEEEEYFTPTEIEESDYPNWRTDEIQKMLYLAAHKARQKEILQMKQDRPRMFAYTKSKLSKESLE